MKPDISIIVVNYNGLRFLKDCLDSIAEKVLETHEIIVVDNASVDGSVEYLRKNFPAIKLIVSERNLGFAGGNNLGAREAKGEFILLLNNDTKIVTSLSPAVSLFADEKLGVLGCRMRYADGRLQYSVGRDIVPSRMVLSWLGLAGYRSAPSVFKRMVYDAVRYDAPMRDADWVSGAFLMTRKSLWQKLGGLDERYFMYMEDVDFCKRTRLLGFRVAYTPLVEILHFEGSGKEWIGARALRDTMRSFLIYQTKFGGFISIIFIRTGLAFVMALRGAVFYLKGGALCREKYTAYLDAAKELLHYRVLSK